MDAIALLTEARAAGLKVNAVGDRLRVRGPAILESLAVRLLEAKKEILAALRDAGCGYPVAGSVPDL